MKLPIIQNRKNYFMFSGTLIVITLLSLIAWGLKPGIDFTGGSLMEVSFKDRPDNEKVRESLKEFDLGEIGIQPVGQNSAILRFKNIDESLHNQIVSKLENDFANKDQSGVVNNEAKDVSNEPQVSVLDGQGNPIDSSNGGISIIATPKTTSQSIDKGFTELRFESVGPNIGKELKSKSYKAIFYVVLAIILYIALVFSKVSKPIASWKYGVIAVIALLHDVMITLGVFVFLGHYLDVEITTASIVALLTISGYSVNDTIIIFDRIRENLRSCNDDFEKIVNNSVNETLTRSLFTSFATLLTLLAIYFFGGESIRSFVLVLLIGIVTGTYSSIFIASPLLVTWQKLEEKFRG